ncbi:MAG: UvrD-helicase domain-containing protein [Clostridia bacterium]|nr:UvrD-helicase domain-containing protein [Clostridia bacterium]
MELTKSQKAAVETRGRSLMISAAAGSGKTATLTKRIISLLTDENEPADISEMLVVTFTRAAAAELKSRITDALTAAAGQSPDSARLMSQLTSVGAADICTIDSYYLRLARENFQRASLPAVFRIADEGETALLKKETAADVTEYLFAAEKSFRHFAETLTSARGELGISEYLIMLDNALSKNPDGINALKKYAFLYREEAKGEFFDSRAGKVCRKRLSSLLRGAENRSGAIRELINSHPEAEPYREATDSDDLFIKECLSLLTTGGYNRIRDKLAAFKPQKLGSIRQKDKSDFTEKVAALRKKNRTLISSIVNGILSKPDSEISAAMESCAVFCEEAFTAVSAYSEALSEKKKSRNILEFSDLKRCALRLLIDENGNPTDIAEAERQKYTHIFVDEYQDTDETQDIIFRTISNGTNLFIVGDIKQSIYSFRGAEPTVFSAYRDEYPILGDDTADGAPGAIYMSENFRCAESVIDFTNLVCGFLFSSTEENGAGIGYRKEDDLIFSRKYDTPPAFPAGANDIGNYKTAVILTETTKEGPDHTELELRDIVERIKKLKHNSLRADGKLYSWGDFAILARNRKILGRASALLTAEGIPNSDCDGDDLFENAEVSLFFALLSAIDNPMRDIPLAGALCSPVFGLTLDDLVTVRKCFGNMSLYSAVKCAVDDENLPEELRTKCGCARDRLMSMRKRAELEPLSRFIRSLWKETDAIEFAGADKNGRNKTPAERRKNLEHLYSLALNYEASDYRTLHDFVRYISNLIERGSTVKSDNQPGGDSVQLMTVHKSKGLEFPVVFLAGTAADFNTRETNEPLIITNSDNLGLSVRQTDATGLSSVDNIVRMTAASRLRELSAEEEIRVLYVALTRARDVLYVSASGKEGFIDKLKSNGRDAFAIEGREQILNVGSWAGWISAATSGFSSGDCYTVTENRFGSEESFDDGTVTNKEESAITDVGSSYSVKNGAESDMLSESIAPSEKASEEASEKKDREYTERLKEILKKRFEYEYPYRASSSLPSKLSVSVLFPDALTDVSSDSGADADGFTDITALIQAERENRVQPSFMSDSDINTAADKGTATHLFLQFCNFEKLDGTPGSVADEAARLVTQGFIPEEAAKLIRMNEVVAFTSSAFFKLLKNATETHRETRFNIFLPADRFTTVPQRKKELEDEKIAVQGVIDLFFRMKDGELILCDYKTDRLTKAEMSDRGTVAEVMSERHGEQLSYYAMALERICGKRPDRICVFPLAYGEAVEIKI